eukprot:394949_1
MDTKPAISAALTSSEPVTVAKLNKAGYINVIKQANSLQGSIYKALDTSSNQPVVIKITNKYLHDNQMALSTNFIKENILLEGSVLQHLTKQKDSPNTIVKYVNFLRCNKNYYLILEYAGTDFFDFISTVHNLISRSNLDILQWHKTVKIIFKQMIECIEYIHNKHICHFDISLENFCINDIRISYNENVDIKHSKIVFDSDDIRIKLIDFGLATLFNPGKYKTNKYCGKRGYKSPEVAFEKSTFDARSNDIWCLGVVLFVMVIGCKPWYDVDEADILFVLMMRGDVAKVLKSWDKLHYVNEDLIDLFQSFFQLEKQRITLDEIKQHPWLKY